MYHVTLFRIYGTSTMAHHHIEEDKFLGKQEAASVRKK